MMTSRLHRLLACVLIVGFLGAYWAARSSAQEPETRAAPSQRRADQYGDPLPAGALARLGTVRWRPGNEIDFLAFAAEGKLVVAREPYGVFHIYDFASGKEVHQLGRSQRVLGEKTHRCSRSVLADGGRFLAFFAGRDRSLHVWEVATGRELWNQPLDPEDFDHEPLAFSADGRTLAIWQRKSRTLSLRETTTGKELGQVQPPAAPPNTDEYLMAEYV